MSYIKYCLFYFVRYVQRNCSALLFCFTVMHKYLSRQGVFCKNLRNLRNISGKRQDIYNA